MKSLYPKSVVVLASILSFNGCGKNLHVNLPSNQNAIRANTFATPLISGKDGMSGSKILFGIQNPTVTDGSFGDMYMNTRTGDIFSLEMSGWVLKGNVKGPKGDTGEKGAQGEVGKAGLDGVPGTSASNKILGGTSAPDDKKGMAGDLYVNQTTTELFQKSPDDKWALLFKMKGDRGDGGQASPGMYYGSGKPTGEVTPVGASYLDVGSGDVFTRLPDGSYQKMFHVGGAAANGKDGSQILDGVGAPDPKSGVAGDYYFEDLSSDLYRKEADGQWKLRMTLHPQPVPVQAISPVDANPVQTAAVSAVPFASGEGKDGANAIPVGGTYLDTSTGDLLTKKPDQKLELLMNLKGAKGSEIFNGKGAPAQTLGQTSDYYLDTDSMDLSTKDKNGTWVLVGTLKGNQGPQGPQGEAGVDGTSGRNSVSTHTIETRVIDLPLSLENAQLGFAFGKSAIDLTSVKKLEMTARLIQKYGNKIAQVQVAGYADKVGAENLNRNLSGNRATAVARVLGKNGLDRKGLVVSEGKGEMQISKCAAANSGDQTKGDHLKCALDRRVDINLIFNSQVSVTEKNAMIVEMKQDFNGIWNK